METKSARRTLVWLLIMLSVISVIGLSAVQMINSLSEISYALHMSLVALFLVIIATYAQRAKLATATILLIAVSLLVALMPYDLAFRVAQDTTGVHDKTEHFNGIVPLFALYGCSFAIFFFGVRALKAFSSFVDADKS